MVWENGEGRRLHVASPPLPAPPAHHFVPGQEAADAVERVYLLQAVAQLGVRLQGVEEAMGQCGGRAREAALDRCMTPSACATWVARSPPTHVVCHLAATLAAGGHRDQQQNECQAEGAVWPMRRKGEEGTKWWVKAVRRTSAGATVAAVAMVCKFVRQMDLG